MKLSDIVVANALGLFSPVIVLSLFAVIAGLHGDTLDTETAFTTIAILSMVTHPANMASLDLSTSFLDTSLNRTISNSSLIVFGFMF